MILASDLGLHCLPMSHKKDAMLICYFVTFNPNQRINHHVQHNPMPNIEADVLLHLLIELGERNKMRDLPSI